MNPELSVILFAVDVGFLVILLAGAVWSVAFPAKRAWPPPQRRSWQYLLTWAFFDAVIVSNAALIFLDWNSWVFPSPHQPRTSATFAAGFHRPGSASSLATASRSTSSARSIVSR